MERIKVKSILSKVKYGNDWFGVDYNINLYRGCFHGCIYCDSRSECYHIDDFDVVKGKENALGILEKELISKRDSGVIGIGSMSDAYNHLESVYEETRGALNLICKYGFGVSIDTKSDLILRDLDLLVDINKKSSVIVKFSITTPRDDLSRIIEPRVIISSKRFYAMKKLSDNGIFVGVLLNPVLPFITDSESEVKELVRLSYLNGAKFIYTYMGMTLRDKQRDYYYDMLDKYFVGLKDKYVRFYGDRYNVLVPDYKRLYRVFTQECDKYGILYDMNDIIKAYKRNKANEQISLF